jgi:L-ribulose-5-phosphate 3-epimerase
MQINGHEIGVCSWSVNAKSVAELAQIVRGAGLDHVQLNLVPLLAMNDVASDVEIAEIKASGLNLTAGMIGFVGEDYSSILSIRRTGGLVPDEAWDSRKEFALASLPLCKILGLKILSFHAGFIPSSGDEGYAKMLERLGELAEPFGAVGISLALETGQESATELLQFLNDLRVRNVQVNFDPANMILYGSGDPIEAVRILGRHIGHVHIKDAIPSDMPRVKWGTEVVFGTGKVGAARFLKVLDEVGYKGPLVIEREVGADRVEEVKAAVAALRA